MATCQTVTVIGTASFVVENVNVDTMSPHPGDTVTVTGSVRNTGTAAGTATVALFINSLNQGAAFQRTVSNVGVGQAASVTITFSAPAAGSTLNTCIQLI
jgi:uncharacterized repeat protein (TIGR01451 family)